MTINLLILQLAILFLPGLIWARLDAGYAAKEKPTGIDFIVRAFVFGLAAYAVVFVIYSAFGWPFTVADIADANKKTIVTAAVFHELLWGLGIGLILGILWIYAATYKCLTRLLQLIRATKKYGDEDVWDFMFNSSQPHVEYIHFRDFANGLVYCGWVDAFSATGRLREIVLREVKIYSSGGEAGSHGSLLFEVPHLYVARPPEGIHIELPYDPSLDAQPTPTGP